MKQEFDAIRQEAEAVREAASPKSLEIEQRQAAAVRRSVETASVESVAQRISSLNGEVSRTLLELSEKLTVEVDLLTRVREAVALEPQDLERLHKIDIAATSLDQMVQDYAREQERLETEIGTRRTEWEQEARTGERDCKEAEEAARKQRQRENEDYEYRKQLERKKAQDRYDEEAHLLAQKNEERQREFERSWSQREATLTEREEELTELRQRTGDLPRRIEAEKKRSWRRRRGKPRRDKNSRFWSSKRMLKRSARWRSRLPGCRKR